jgi:asparagine synthetase B (glutamine-hydrolysing)
MVGFGLSLPGELRYPFRRPKEMLKSALSRHVPETIARRSKLGFGQPIFEWLSPGGQLRRLVDRLEAREFIEPAVLEQAKNRPGWFLYSLLCYDLWHRMFIERSLARPTAPTPSYREGSAGLAVAG